MIFIHCGKETNPRERVTAMEFIPSDVRPKMILLVLGAIGFAVISVVIVAKRKKMAYEVWVPSLIICILCAVGTFLVAICLAAAFVMAT